MISTEVELILATIDSIFTKSNTCWQAASAWTAYGDTNAGNDVICWTKWLDEDKDGTGTQGIRIYLYSQSICIYQYLDGAINTHQRIEVFLDDPRCFDKLREYEKSYFTINATADDPR